MTFAKFLKHWQAGIQKPGQNCRCGRCDKKRHIAILKRISKMYDMYRGIYFPNNTVFFSNFFFFFNETYQFFLSSLNTFVYSDITFSEQLTHRLKLKLTGTKGLILFAKCSNTHGTLKKKKSATKANISIKHRNFISIYPYTMDNKMPNTAINMKHMIIFKLRNQPKTTKGNVWVEISFK